MGEGGGADCGEQRHYPRPFTVAPAVLSAPGRTARTGHGGQARAEGAAAPAEALPSAKTLSEATVSRLTRAGGALSFAAGGS